jgi:H+/Cl- antiporter ClcA
VRVLQWLLILSALGGGVWLGAAAVVDYLQMPELSLPKVLDIPIPTIMLLGGVALGILLGLVCRVLVRLTARSRARSADRRLHAGIRETCQELVLQPLEAELAAYEQVRSSLGTVVK